MASARGTFRRTGRLVGRALAAAGVIRTVRRRRRHAAFSHEAERQVGDGTVRQAGPEAMRDPPRHWSSEDEASDGSFPASDSAAKY